MGNDVSPDVKALADEVLRQETGLADGSLVDYDGFVYESPVRQGLPAVWFTDEATLERSATPPDELVRISGYDIDGDRGEMVILYRREQAA